jgi:Domain of unknown function (DUF4157)
MARGSFEFEANSGKLTQRTGDGPLRTLAEVGRSDDAKEQEADRVAEQVLHTSAPVPVSSSQDGSSIRRKSETHDAGGSSLIPSLGQGKPLDPADRSYFEPRLGLSLEHVRVHADPQAADSAHALHASAYTLGRDVVFGEGRYQPGTQAGRRLLAHELAHVAQARNGAKPVIHRQPEGDADAGPAETEVRGTLEVKKEGADLCDSAKRTPNVKKPLTGGTRVEATHDAGNYWRVRVGDDTGYVLKSKLLGTIKQEPKKKDPKEKDTEKLEHEKKHEEHKPPVVANPYQGIIDRATQTLTTGDGEKFWVLDPKFGSALQYYAHDDPKKKLPDKFGGDDGWGAAQLKPAFKDAGWKPGQTWYALFTIKGVYMLATLTGHKGRSVGGKTVGPPVPDGLEARYLLVDWEARLTANKAMP